MKKPPHDGGSDHSLTPDLSQLLRPYQRKDAPTDSTAPSPAVGGGSWGRGPSQTPQTMALGGGWDVVKELGAERQMPS